MMPAFEASLSGGNMRRQRRKVCFVIVDSHYRDMTETSVCLAWLIANMVTASLLIEHMIWQAHLCCCYVSQRDHKLDEYDHDQMVSLHHCR